MENAVFYHNYKEMKADMERYRKLEDIKHEDFRTIQGYMQSKSLETTRMAYRIRCKMVKSIKMNFKNSYRNLKCENCDTESLDSQDHAIRCAALEEQRRGLELHKIEDLVEFFHWILKEKGKKGL